MISTELPLGGFGISRYCLDHTLANKALINSAEIVQDMVTDVAFANEQFTISTQGNRKYTSPLVIGAYGKRSNLDKTLSRDFFNQSSPYLAVKAHYRGDFPDDQVSLHNFEGGYCGLSKVETDLVNVCYITDYKSFKKYKNIEDFQQQLMSKNTYLRDVFETYTLSFDKPLTISQISFASKHPVENHILMCGDSAGLIHPLAGNGMSMAIRSGQMVSKLILDFHNGRIGSRQALEDAYSLAWKTEFQTRLSAGHLIARLFRIPILSDVAIRVLKWVPSLLPKIISRTHGKPMTV